MNIGLCSYIYYKIYLFHKRGILKFDCSMLIKKLNIKLITLKNNTYKNPRWLHVSRPNIRNPSILHRFLRTKWNWHPSDDFSSLSLFQMRHPEIQTLDRRTILCQARPRTMPHLPWEPWKSSLWRDSIFEQKNDRFRSRDLGTTFEISISICFYFSFLNLFSSSLEIGEIFSFRLLFDGRRVNVFFP